MSTHPRVSVGIPLFNEERGVPELIRRVGAVLDGIPGGPHEIVWDGRDDAGRPAASGSYYCVSEVGGARNVRQILLIR